MSGIPIKGSDNNTYITRTETSADGQETQVISGIADWILNRLLRAVSRLTFDVSNQLRVAGPVTVSSGTVTTVTTCGTVTTMATGNMGMGDMGKPATSMVFSRQLTTSSTGRNLIRS